jgi:hypothetical protein
MTRTQRLAGADAGGAMLAAEPDAEPPRAARDPCRRRSRW